MLDGKFILKIYRGYPERQFWEEFALDRAPSMNVISALMEIQKNPINRSGKKVEPVVWEMACLEEVCGSCSMLINGIPQQACTALIEALIKKSGNTTITLAPFTKFLLIRDLVVDRSRMFQDLKKIQGWIPLDELHSEEYGPRIPPVQQESMYIESTCMTCGCCLEACPQVNGNSEFIGPAAINQVKLFNTHPTGRFLRRSRLKTMMEEGGVSDCGNSQNCVQVCPKGIPLTSSIGQIGRDTSRLALGITLGLPENDP